MKITDIISKSDKPEIYEKGTSFMWSDKHISKQLLNVHLDEDIDLASRKKTSIEKTTNWILNIRNNDKMEILDLGCGPGLYAEIYAQHGHSVTGVDISKNSIEYAKNQAKSKELDISYINASYLDLELAANRFDVVTLIYTDFGVLIPSEREKLLKFVFRILKKGGLFVFDVLNDNDLTKKMAPKNWELANSGFWKNEPYIALSESFLYEQEKVILYQHIIIDEDENIENYRFWTHFYSHADLENMLTKYEFGNIIFCDNILPEGDLWNGKNVTFCIAEKR